MKFTVNDAINLYQILSGCQINTISNQDARTKMLKNGVKILGIVKEFESSRDKVMKDNQGKADKDSLFAKAVEELLKEDVDTEQFVKMTPEELESLVPSIPNYTIGMYAIFEELFGEHAEETKTTK